MQNISLEQLDKVTGGAEEGGNWWNKAASGVANQWNKTADAWSSAKSNVTQGITRSMGLGAR